MAHEREHGRVQRRCARRDETTSRADLEKPTINGTKFACPGRCRRKTCGFSTSGDGALDHLEQPAAQPKLHGAATRFHEHLHAGEAAATAPTRACCPACRVLRVEIRGSGCKQRRARGAGDEVTVSLSSSLLTTVPSMAGRNLVAAPTPSAAARTDAGARRRRAHARLQQPPPRLPLGKTQTEALACGRATTKQRPGVDGK